MAKSVTIAQQLERIRLDFSSDKTRLMDLFGSKPITIAEMQTRLWEHIEQKKLVDMKITKVTKKSQSNSNGNASEPLDIYKLLN